MKYAPIVLFVFNRPQHTLRLIESLSKNVEFCDSPLFVYCDGARNDDEVGKVEEVRQVINEISHPNLIVVEREENWGLAKSVIAGITELCERFGRVIVLEDDLIVSPVFLNYMNTALNRYDENEQIMQISGHMFPVNIKAENDAVILPFTTSWGWATWDRAWKYFDAEMTAFDTLEANKSMRYEFDFKGAYPAFRMLKRQAEGKVDSWAIRWYLSVFSRGGTVAFPKKTLVLNDGFDGSGTNCHSTLQIETEGLGVLPITKFPGADVDYESFNEVISYLKKDQSVLRKLIKYVGGVWRK